MDISLVDFYSRLGTIAIILVLGFLLGKLKLIDTKGNRMLVNLLLNVFMPASLFVAFPDKFDEAASDLFFKGLAAGIIVMLALILASRLIFNKMFYKGELRFESQFALIFNNATFLGYPIIYSTFGDQGIVPYCGFIIAFNIALFSYGVYLFERKLTSKLFWGIIKNPNIVRDGAIPIENYLAWLRDGFRKVYGQCNNCFIDHLYWFHAQPCRL